MHDDAGRRLPSGEINGGVQQRLIGDGATGLQSTGSGDNQLGAGIVNTCGKFLRRKSAEDNRMDRAEPRTGEHGDNSLRHHRHIDDDAVALHNAVTLKNTGEGRHFVEQFRIGEMFDLAHHGAVIDERVLIAATGGNMTVKRVPARVAGGTGEPAVCPVDGRGGRHPVNVAGGVRPELMRIVFPFCISVAIKPHSRFSQSSGFRQSGGPGPFSFSISANVSI